MDVPPHTPPPERIPDLVLDALGSVPDLAVLVFDRNLRAVRGDVAGRKVSELVPDADAEAFETACRKALDGEQSTLIHPFAGRVHRSMFAGSRDDQGLVVGGVVVTRDVTEEHRALEDLERRERDFRALAEEASDVMSRHSLDGTYLYVSPACRRLFGFEPEELIGHSAYENFHPDDAERTRNLLAEALSRTDTITTQFRTLRKDGSWAWVESAVRHTVDPATGRVTDVIAVTRDITSQRLAQQAERRFETAFADAPIGMALVDVEGRFMKTNRALHEITGYPEDELGRLTFQDITHPDDLKADLAFLEQLVAGEIPGYQMEKRYYTQSGALIWVLLSVSLVRDDDGAPLHFVSQIQDITERKRMEDHLQHLADQDPLTGLMNRRRFEDELQRQVSRCVRYGEQAALLLLDLDHFKFVNDTLGHKTGDRLLKAVAGSIRERLRASDVCARVGGDEFAVVLLGADAAEAQTIAEGICERIRETVLDADGEEIRTTASVGVVTLDGDVEDVFVAADVAMYDAKALGRDRALTFGADTDAAGGSPRGLPWQQGVRRALADQRFELHAQPIVELATGAVANHELLLRLRHENGELLPPVRFLEVAEHLGHMRRLDRWVIDEAVHLLASSDLDLAVNLSGPSLSDATLATYVERAIAAASVDPTRLIFEVTETTAIENMREAVSFAERLAGLGCRMALDDFGSGYASFAYLRALPLDFVKLDGDYVRGLTESPRDRALVRAIAQMAVALGYDTIAEHVEDAETAELLMTLGIRLGQGYHFARPAPLDLPSAASSAPAG
jgi:diguanylate cyclase (GGDEF)-like protein/PAS domain S-box-containing protein